MRTKTYNAGATAERTAILAHVRRLVKKGEALCDGKVAIDGTALVTWLLARDDRYNKKPKGVGK